MGTKTDTPNVRADARSRKFFENLVVGPVVLGMSIAIVAFIGWYVLVRPEASTQSTQIVDTAAAVATATPANDSIVVKRSAIPTAIPNLDLQQDAAPISSDMDVLTASSSEATRRANALVITNLASGMKVRKASASQIDVEFPELIGVPVVTVEELDNEVATLDVLLNAVNLSQSTDDPDKVAIENAAWTIRRHVSDDMALQAFYAGFMNNASNREFAAIQALINKASPDELNLQAEAVVRASHEVEAAMVFLNPISGQGSYIELDQNLFSESAALLDRLRSLHVELVISARTTPVVAEAPQALPTAMPSDLPGTNSQPFPNIDPRSVPRSKPLPDPVNLNTPAKASTVFEETEANAQFCEGPVLLNGEVVIGAMPANLVNWLVWGKSHLGGSTYTRPMYRVVRVLPYAPAPVDLINEHPIVVDFPVVEYLMEKTLGEGPGVVSFYVTDEGHAKLIELGVVEGRLIEFNTILGLLGP